VARLQPPPDPGVYEITNPAAWVGLVEAYPLDVSPSRGSAWTLVSNADGPLLIPDWAAVSADYDAIHLTVLAYLGTAGRAIAVGAGVTILAGCEPDVTYWLTDVLTQAGEPTAWIAVDRLSGSPPGVSSNPALAPRLAPLADPLADSNAMDAAVPMIDARGTPSEARHDARYLLGLAVRPMHPRPPDRRRSSAAPLARCATPTARSTARRRAMPSGRPVAAPG